MRKGKPRRPAPDEMLTMAPYPALSISGTANRMHKYELVKQESIVYRQSSMRYSWTALVGPASPALFTSVSSLPNSLTALATVRRTSSSALASQAIAIALPPAAVIPAAVSFTRSPERAAQTTAAPSRAKRWLIALPIPRDAPVMSATRPSSNPILPSDTMLPNTVCHFTPPSVACQSRLVPDQGEHEKSALCAIGRKPRGRRAAAARREMDLSGPLHSSLRGVRRLVNPDGHQGFASLRSAIAANGRAPGEYATRQRGSRYRSQPRMHR